MANLAAANVTINQRWTEGGNLAQKGFAVLDVTMDLSTVNAGGFTNTIPASAFGLTTITEVHPRANANSGTDVAVIMQPSLDGSKILAFDIETATDATRGDPVDLTVDVRAIVKGVE